MLETVTGDEEDRKNPGQGGKGQIKEQDKKRR